MHDVKFPPSMFAHLIPGTLQNRGIANPTQAQVNLFSIKTEAFFYSCMRALPRAIAQVSKPGATATKNIIKQMKVAYDKATDRA